jgi:hypothetical protein
MAGLVVDPLTAQHVAGLIAEMGDEMIFPLFYRSSETAGIRGQGPEGKQALCGFLFPFRYIEHSRKNPQNRLFPFVWKIRLIFTLIAKIRQETPSHNGHQRRWN